MQNDLKTVKAALVRIRSHINKEIDSILWDVANDAITLIERIEAGQEWQKIESAWVKEGHPVYPWGQEYDPPEPPGYYNLPDFFDAWVETDKGSGREPNCRLLGRATLVNANGDCLTWSKFPDNASGEKPTFRRITHWRPLPPPPQQQGEGL